MRKSGEGARRKGRKSVSEQTEAGQGADSEIVVGRRYNEIDGLRCVAALLVIWGHAAEIAVGISAQAATSNFYTDFARLGSSGVTLFFVISGFLITGILIDIKDRPQRLKTFYIRRSLRIFPLYYFGILFIFILSLFFAKKGGAYDLPTVYLYHLLYISNWVPFFDWDNFATLYADVSWLAHLWSLAVEEQFYIIWPAVFFFLHKRLSHRRLIAILLALILFAAVLRIVMTLTWMWLPAYISTVTRMDALFCGALLAILMKQSPASLEKINRAARALAPITAAFIVLVFLVGTMKTSLLFCIPVFIVPLTTMLYVFWVNSVIVAGPDKFWRRLLNTRTAQRAGEISYGLYIFSAPVQIALGKVLFGIGSTNFWVNNLLVLVVGFAITYALASMSYRYMEKPILGFKDVLAPYGKKPGS